MANITTVTHLVVNCFCAGGTAFPEYVAAQLLCLSLKVLGMHLNGLRFRF